MQSSQNPSSPLRFGPWITAVMIGLAASLSLASIDLILSVVFGRFGVLREAGGATAYFAGSLLVLVSIYVLLWVVVGLPAKLIFKLPVSALSIALVATVAFPLLLGVLGARNLDLRQLDGSPYSIVMAMGLSLATGVLAYLVGSAVDRDDERSRRVAWAFVVAPLILVEALAILWLRFNWLGGPLSWRSVVFFLVALVLLAGTAQLLRKPGVEQHVPMILLAVALIACLVAGVRALSLGPSLTETAPVFSQAHRVKRVLLITIDTLRQDSILTGKTPSDSPNIDTLAQQSVVFENAYVSAPWTPPSIASIMTGLAPWAHTVSRRQTVFPAAPPYLPDVMLDAGYATAAFGANSLLTYQSALSRGFQTYHFPERGRPNTLGMAALRTLLGPVKMSDQHWTEEITALAEQWIELHRERDFFLWLHYFDPHAPYIPPGKFLADMSDRPPLRAGFEFGRSQILSRLATYSPRQKRWLKDLYRGEVRYVDDRVGRLIDTLKRLGLYDESLIVVTSDHGEEFWEHGGVRHGHTFYNELLMVPLLVKPPLSSAPFEPKVIENVSTTSVMPTVLEMCGLAFNPGQFSAPSLAPWFSETAEAGEGQPLFAAHPNYFEDRAVVVEGRWKYIRFEHEERRELYDLVADPAEQQNTANREQDRVTELEALITRHRQESVELKQRYGIGRPASTAQRERIREQLKSLGYIQ